MGYFLPINFDHYKQYQLRAIKRRDNFYEIKHVPKSKQAFNERKGLWEKVYAEITGTGKFINEKI